ncbi:ferrous iron transport protein B [Clostridium sp. JN-1]|uniref:ferrous iron transport protein B n=1 Tax=Clostridium sp. JN-1 TaxID=2483110 RepID=UPI000F0BBAFF|nr:ferrous iron transport protein B [Clostridium sp. JN-1]
MGLTNDSTGIKAVDSGLVIKKSTPDDKVIAVAGNPNVGKSTVFNNLTGLNQHTGNWPGKTVTNAQGYCHYADSTYVLVDIPGTYSLMAHSVEEEVARNFICFGDPDAVVVVCDATCLERNFNLVLQTLEITNKVVVCVNLMDEAKKKNIRIDLDAISQKLGVPVVGTTARKKKSLGKLMQSVSQLLCQPEEKSPFQIKYSKPIEDAIAYLEPFIKQKIEKKINTRWLSLKLLDYDETLITALNEYLGYELISDEEIQKELNLAKKILSDGGITSDALRDKIVSGLVLAAEYICSDTVHFDKANYNAMDRKFDSILTNKWTGFPIMIALLMGVFWLTITGANYPSQLISDGLFWVQDRLTDVFQYMGAPDWLHGMLVLGVYRVLAWVVSVMLPPMAIFFPLFTLLEDLGYLPRVAFNLDKYFKKCCACGKQALTMCMGFGCNAAGIVGCRIIDSPRERLIAIITNNFVPCNGRFPTLIAILTMFFVGAAAGPFESVFSAVLLTGMIVLGIFMTFIVSKILSKTILKGVPSSFTLELPPYRKPQIGKVIVRSIFDRTLFVLGRAVVVAAPVGLIIWVMANISFGNMTLLAHCSSFLDPFAKMLGMDGVILLAFILGFPANEIVVPIIIMTYMSSGSIMELDSLWDLKQLLVNNGWTWITAISTMLFSLMHWPCSTTCLTIKKETQSLKWTAVSFAVPTIMGIIVCFAFANVARLFI